jgi:hypothetical protein
MSGSKPRGTGADNGHLLIPLFNLGQREILNVHLISHKPFQGTNGNGLIYFTPPAGCLTRMRTNATYGSWERKGAENYLHSLLVFALSNQGHIGVRIDIIGTSVGAGGAITLVYYVSPWDGLGVGFVGGLPGADTLVELAGHGHRANLSAITATGTPVQINESRQLSEFSL